MLSEKEHDGCRVLVVDDDDIVLQVLRDILEGIGMIVIGVTDGENAAEKLQQEHFELVVADKNLPGIGGLEVLRRAKAVDTRMGTLLVTAHASRESAEEAMSIGIDDYIVKPFDVKDLVKKVERSLKRRQTRSGVSLLAPAAEPPDLRILVCDSNETSRRVIQAGIDLLGYDVEVVEDLDAVTEALSHRLFHGLICDLGILNSSDSALGFLRVKLDMLPEIHFVVVSTGKNLDSAIAGLSHGANRVIYRPLGSKELVASSLRGILGEACSVKESVKVLVARRNLDMNTLLNSNVVNIIEMPERSVSDDMVTAGNLERIVGELLAIPRLKGDLILYSCLRSRR